MSGRRLYACLVVEGHADIWLGYHCRNKKQPTPRLPCHDFISSHPCQCVIMMPQLARLRNARSVRVAP